MLTCAFDARCTVSMATTYGCPARRLATPGSASSVAEINRLDPLPDIAVITGDLVDHGEPAEYEHLRTLLAPLAMPVFVIPGNHDAPRAAARRLRWRRLSAG
jgi:3',5'-cyclic AMP phosphodiesterase CpdA